VETMFGFGHFPGLLRVMFELSDLLCYVAR